jgi:OOP family OmpA-OmpF porin
MRKLIFWLALCAGLIATPAFARDGAWYVGGEFGGMIVEDTNVDIGAVDNAVRLNYDYGYDGGLFVGYDLGGFRIEAEAAYKKADLDAFNTLIQLPGEGSTFPPARPFAGGSASALSFMINGMLDFGDDDGISGFVGGGVGMARVKANNERVFANTAPFLNDSDSKLAWQVFAGVRQRVTENIDVTVKYRFFNVDNVRMTAFNGNEAELRFRSHSLLGGITFNFGGSPPPKTACIPKPGQIIDPMDNQVCRCPDNRNWHSTYHCGDIPVALCDDRVTPKVPGPCPVELCPDNITPKVPGPCPDDTIDPYDVYFGWDKRHIGEPANPGKDPRENADFIRSQLPALQAASAKYDKLGKVRVNIVGRADRSGSLAYNQVLSCDRAYAVRQWFITEKHVPESLIQIQGLGETDAQGVVDREPQDRRVTITVGNVPPLDGCPPPLPSAKY